MTDSSKKETKGAREKMEIRGLKTLTLLQLLLQVFMFVFGSTTVVGTVCFLTVFPTFARQPIHVASNVSYREVETLRTLNVSSSTFLDPIIVNIDTRPLPERPLPDVAPARASEDEQTPAPTSVPAPPRDLRPVPNAPTNLTAN